MACLDVTVIGAANIVAGAFNVTPTTVNVGGTVTATQVVTNNGSAAGTATVTFTANNASPQVKTATIGAGASATISATYQPTSAGTLEVCAVLS